MKSLEMNVLLYRYPEHFVNNLSTCEKTAYLDTNERIDTILPYVNDVSGKTFIKGEENGFLTTYRGFVDKGIQNNSFWEKLKIMISSGIYSYWKTWFKNSKIKREKLFQYYANWTSPKSENVAISVLKLLWDFIFMSSWGLHVSLYLSLSW